MAAKMWITEKVRYCEHAGCKVSLDVEAIFPADHLPDQPPRVTIHRCSHAVDCMEGDCGACVWSGANPDYDPFEK